MKSYFFNALRTNDLETYPSGYDREYDADDHAAFFARFFSEAGVFSGTDADACKVRAHSGTTLAVSAGAVCIRGRMAVFDGTETVTVTQDCKIVVRMDKSLTVRDFQLLAVTELTRTEDVYDLELAEVTLEPVAGGHETRVTDTRTFLSYMGQPAYYPPDSDSLPYVLWLYALGFPMSQEQRAAVEGNPGLISIYNASVGATKADKADVYTREETLSAQTKAALGGVNTPGEAFMALDDRLRFLTNNRYGVKILVTDPDGNPMAGVTIGGLTPISGSGIVTDSKGVAYGFAPSQSVTLSAAGYTDLTFPSVRVACTSGDVTEAVMTAQFKNFAVFTGSTTVKFSPWMTRLDVSACGGGASGRANGNSFGFGGGGGFAIQQENIPFTPDTNISVVVGAGGTSSGNAGSSTMLTVTANGCNSTSGNGNGGTTNKGAGTAGTQSIYSSFTAVKLVGGGGGAGYDAELSGEVLIYGAGGSGGNPYGGSGGGVYVTGGYITPQNGNSARGVGGGGGGRGAVSIHNTRGVDGTGYRGEVAIRMWHGEESA